MHGSELLPPELIARSITASSAALVTAVFGRSKSKNFPAVFNIAKQSQSLDEIDIEGSFFYMATFGSSASQCALALGFIQFAQNWKGVHFFVNGRICYNLYDIIKVLECFHKSSRCSNKQAYCHTIAENIGGQKSYAASTIHFSLGERTINPNLEKMIPDSEKNKGVWIHPCRLLSYSNYLSELDSRHPASLQDQLQAQAVSNNCDICPNFNHMDLKRL